MIKEISDKDFSGVMKGYNVIKFYSNSCPPCKMLSPILEKISGQYKKFNFYSVNVENCPEFVSSFGIRSVPTVSILIDGDEQDRLNGLYPEKEYERVLSKYL